MIKKILTLVLFAMGLLVLSGCSTKKTIYPRFTSDPIAQTPEFIQKTDNVFVILDNSSSTNATYDGNDSGDSKFDVEKKFLYRLNETIPKDIEVSTSILSFGSGPCLEWGLTKQRLEISNHSHEKFLEGLTQAECASGGSPLNRALARASTELDPVKGNIALLIVGDGTHPYLETLNEAKILKDKFGDRLCIYSVWVGNRYDLGGRFILQELSDISKCGNSKYVSDLISSASMAEYTEDMLFDKVPDALQGMSANVSDIKFKIDSSIIQETYEGLLGDLVSTLKRNPSISLNIEGHTDNTGSEAYNIQLSRKRALAIKNYFVEKGIEESHLTIKFLGESSPSTRNDSALRRAKNRRVTTSFTERSNIE